MNLHTFYNDINPISFIKLHQKLHYISEIHISIIKVIKTLFHKGEIFKFLHLPSTNIYLYNATYIDRKYGVQAFFLCLSSSKHFSI